MPELPEVETVRRGLEPFLVGNAFARVEQRRADLRFPLPSNFAKRLTGRKVEALDRRAKYLLARLDGGEVLVMHLGMTGRFSIDCPRRSKRPSRKRANTSQGFDDAPVAFGEFVPAQERPPKHEHIVFHLGDGTTLRYSDARRFGLMDLVPSNALEGHALFRDLGVEPLSSAFTP